MAQRQVALVCTVAAVVALAAGCSSDGGGSNASPTDPAPRSLECEWPMFGRDPSRTFAYPSSCETAISPGTVGRLQEKWFRKTSDVVTATPAVADDTAYVGDWSGEFYAISTVDGSIRWVYAAEPHKNVYSGQIVASAAVADIGGERRVVFASGKTVYAVRASDGTLRWKHELNPEGDEDDLTEIQSSPLVTDGLVVVGYDGHDSPGNARRPDRARRHDRRRALELRLRPGWPGDRLRRCVELAVGRHRPGPRVRGHRELPERPDRLERVQRGDLRGGSSDRRTPVVVPATRPEQQRLRLRGRTERVRRRRNAGRRARRQGRRLLRARPREREAGLEAHGGRVAVQAKNFSTGGFIGATAVGEGLVVGGTAIGGPCPCLHAIDADDGELAWQETDAGPTYAPSAIVNGVAFAGSTTDFTLRALDLESGAVLWSRPLAGGIAGGAVVAGDTVVAVAGIREPGVDAAGTEAGVYGFEVGPPGATTTTQASAGTLPPTTMAPPPTAPDPNAPTDPECIGRPCALDFTLVAPPTGRQPSMTVHLRPDPFRIEVRADDLGDPDAWIHEGADKDAVAYGVFVSDDSLKGTLLCVLDGDYDCVNDVVPENPGRKYNRISVLAIENSPALPAASEGFNQLVTTKALDQPVSFK